MTRQVGDLWNNLALTPTPTLLRIDGGVSVSFRLRCFQVVADPAACAVEFLCHLLERHPSFRCDMRCGASELDISFEEGEMDEKEK